MVRSTSISAPAPAPTSLRAPLLGLLLLLVASLPSIAHAVDIPTLQPCLNDFAGVVDAAQAADIQSLCRQMWASNRSQVAILLLPTTSPWEMDEFAARTLERNGIGAEGADNGLLVVIATEDRTWRVEVGYGLEGTLNDGKVGAIARSALLPALREGEYGSGLLATLPLLQAELEGAPAPAPLSEPPLDPLELVLVLLGILVLFLFVLLVLYLVLGSLLNFLPPMRGGSGAYGGGFGSGGWSPPSSGGFGGFSGGFGGGSSGGGGAGGRF